MQVDRRSFMGGAGALGALAVTGEGQGAAPKAARPNIIFIMADDLGYADLSCTRSHHIRTPAIDSIGAQGIMLRQGYANSAICSPTRTALLTGCYQYRFPIGVEEPLGPGAPAGIGVPLDRPTIASVLRAQGYRTRLVGKWHLGEPPKHSPLHHGYDEFFGIIEGAADYFRHHMVMGGKDVGIGLAQGDTPIERNGYLTDLFGDEAVKTIEAPGDTPFFLSLHFNAPHWPWEGREDAAVAPTLGASFHYNGGSLAKYKAMVEAMDQNVAKLLAALDRSGKADNTIILFTSDNGGERFSETWPFTGVKGELLEGGIRVPLLARWPGRIAPGSTSDQVMISMDFLPTLLTMAGGTVGKAGTFDGMDLSAQLTGKAAPVDRSLYWRFKANGQAALRQGDWKYLKLGGKEHLFNLAQDERERADLAADDPARLKAMRLQWDSWNAQMLSYPLGSYSEDVRDHYADRY
ncbi:sulfatase-like hydrolase/transferase [Sphingobium sp.]|uniref:sulfatase family protein n=1 Tax=Sphingobium sp. TaxID=1912891 RepID=UPI0025EC94C0|nr:sulfatase-like hydrolase/transferase [Sphingobium sp.]